MPYELTKLLTGTIKIEIDKKITGKATVNIKFIKDILNKLLTNTLKYAIL